MWAGITRTREPAAGCPQRGGPGHRPLRDRGTTVTLQKQNLNKNGSRAAGSEPRLRLRQTWGCWAARVGWEAGGLLPRGPVFSCFHPERPQPLPVTSMTGNPERPSEKGKRSVGPPVRMHQLPCGKEGGRTEHQGDECGGRFRHAPRKLKGPGCGALTTADRTASLPWTRRVWPPPVANT